MHLDESIRQFFEHSIGNPRHPRHRWGRWGQQHQAHTGVRSLAASEPIRIPNLSDSKLPYYFVGRSLQRHRVRLPVWRGRGSTWLVVMRDLDSKCRLGGRSKNKFFPVFANHWLGKSFLQPRIPVIHFLVFYASSYFRNTAFENHYLCRIYLATVCTLQLYTIFHNCSAKVCFTCFAAF